jgi:hypothetical protein
VGNRAGASPVGADEPGNCPLTDDLVAGLPPRTCPSRPRPTHTRPSDVQFSRCTGLNEDRQLAAEVTSGVLQRLVTPSEVLAFPRKRYAETSQRPVEETRLSVAAVGAESGKPHREPGPRSCSR